jgi:hypothetical protein
MSTNAHAGDLSRVKTHDPSSDWPTRIEIVAIWARNGGRGRRRSVQINADQFFGTGEFGAPMSGEQLIGMVEKLRKQGAWYGVKGRAKGKRW